MLNLPVSSASQYSIKWNEHVYDIVKKASKRLYMLGHGFFLLDYGFPDLVFLKNQKKNKNAAHQFSCVVFVSSNDILENI